MAIDVDRASRERDFHNDRFGAAEDPRSGLDKWYTTISHGAAYQDRIVKSSAIDRDVLEFGCASGWLSLEEMRLQKVAATVSGIDISDVAIEQAKRRAEAAGIDNARFYAMDAHKLDFPTDAFDVVFGRGIIHHLDLEGCFSEIARVLRSGGIANFYEPMGHNPVLNAFRNKTPEMRTPDEHPIILSDFKLARKFFSNVDVKYFGLMTVPSAAMPKALRSSVYWVGRALDAALLRIPGIKHQAWYASITLQAK